jgi:DNA-binding response OmpR family regulator
VVIERVIDVHIGKLRQKIEPKPSTPRHILTVRGLGYRFADRTGGRSGPRT